MIRASLIVLVLGLSLALALACNPPRPLLLLAWVAGIMIGLSLEFRVKR